MKRNTTEEAADPAAKRKESRAAAIAAAVLEARKRRGFSLREAAAIAKIAPSTLSRLEDPQRAESPQVETLEALAAALQCPLCELLGEGTVIEYRALGAWPDDLNRVLEERGGFITAGERALIEAFLSTEGEQEGRAFWELLLAGYRESPLWRTIAALSEEGWRLDAGAAAGLHAVVLSLIEGARSEWPDKLRTYEYGPI